MLNPGQNAVSPAARPLCPSEGALDTETVKTV